MIFGKRKSNPRLIRSKNNIEKRRDFGESYLEISSGICSGAVPSDFLKSLYLCEDSLITDYWLLITGANSLFYCTTEKYINVPIREDKRCVSWVDPTPTRIVLVWVSLRVTQNDIKKKKLFGLFFLLIWDRIFIFYWIRRLKFYYECNNLITSWIRVYLRK